MASLPGQLTKKLLQSAVQKYLNTDVEVVNLNIENLQEMNRSFCSSLQQLTIVYTIKKGNERKELRLVIKYSPESEEVAKVVESMNAFENEINAYSDILPAINSLDYREKVTAKAVYVTRDPKPVIIMENLEDLGYKIFTGVDGIDTEHCNVVIKKLAYLHAASLAVYEENPQIVNKYKFGIFSNPKVVESLWSVSIPSIQDVCRSTPDLHKYAEKIVYEKTIAKLLSISALKKFSVMNHGDLRVANLMFDYKSNGKPCSVTFVDFQFPVFNTPAIDLNYHWALNTTLDIKMEGPETTLAQYHKSLLKCLEKLKVRASPPTLEELKEDFASTAIYGFASAIICFPMVISQQEPNATLPNFLSIDDESGYRYSAHHNKKYIEHLKLLLPFYDKLGCFN